MSDTEFEWMLAIFSPPAVALLWLGLTYSAARTAAGGRPLSPFSKSLVLYGFFFILGLGYDIFFTIRLGLSLQTVWLTGPALGLVVIAIAWQRYQRTEAEEPGLRSARREPIGSRLAEGLPTVGLIASLIVSAITWESWIEANEHLWLALLGTVAVVVTIVLARRNRRSTVISALRMVVALGVVGAVGHPSFVAVCTVAGLAVVWLLLEALWKEPSSALPDGGSSG